MGFLLVCVIVFVFLVGLFGDSGSESSNQTTNNDSCQYYNDLDYHRYHEQHRDDIPGIFEPVKSYRHKHSSTKKHDFFEEADSYFDRYGNEHIVDYDGYCEECDDYHDC